MSSFPDRYKVLGSRISLVSFDAVSQALAEPRSDRSTVVAVCNVHSVMSARRDPDLAAAIESADIATPDGMPLVWALKGMGLGQPERVYGPEIMRRALTDPSSSHRHFLFGSTPETLARLTENVEGVNPNVRIVGSISPPFRPLAESEEDDIVRRIADSGADVLWVGLGMPKQELWMHRVRERLPGVTMLGVGAAFDFLAGTKREAPQWMRERGLEWLYRLAQEPRRLWRRYLWNNPAYLVLLGGQITAHRLRGAITARRTGR